MSMTSKFELAKVGLSSHVNPYAPKGADWRSDGRAVASMPQFRSLSFHD